VNTIIKSVAAISLLGASVMAQAAIYNIDNVLNGSSGFNASLFHNASGSDPMTGTTLANIPSISVISGLYNDATGDFNATMSVSTGGSFTLSGTGLLFSGGTLAANSQLSLTFTNPTGALQDNEIGFLPGYVCCGSSGLDPNSFIADSGSMVMTLWGANFGGGSFDGNYYTHDLGIDLRLSMTPVPIPATVWLFVSGLMGLVGLARRKQP